MKFNKLFIPILITAFILFLGTSYALGVIGNSNENDAAIPLELAPVEAEQEPEQLLEETPEESQEPLDEQEDEADLAEETEVPKEEAASTDLPQAAPKAVPQPVEEYQVVVTASALNVRPDPSPDNARIGVLMRGQRVDVSAQQGNWLQVRLPQGPLGWVSGNHVSKVSAQVSSSGTSLAGKVIVIDPGHGGRDPGAVGPTGLLEKEVNLDVSLRVVEQLRALGAKVVMTRETDVFLPLSGRVAIAEAAKADVFVSVHANAHPNRVIGGTETYYFGKKSTSNASISLAANIQRELVGALGLRDIGVKEASFHVIRNTTMPSALLELAFLSNAQEESLMRTNEFRQKSADAIVRALQGYFN